MLGLANGRLLAGNLPIGESIANRIIAVDDARTRGVKIDRARHASADAPVTVGSLALVLLWYRLIR